MQHGPIILIATAILIGLASCGDEGPTVTLTSPPENAAVAGGVPVAMTAEGVTIEPAGEARSGYGHFHVIADAGCTEKGTGIAKDADHVHFGKGQTDGVIYLEPGQHELCLQVGDGVHAALDITDTVTVSVGVENRQQWCSVVGEIDALFESVDNSDADLATKHVGYENIRRLVAQAADGIEHVDAAVQDDVTVSLTFAADLSAALSKVDTPDEADAALAPIYERVSDGLPGAEWILEACGVDIAG
jgi:hypothetical protein